MKAAVTELGAEVISALAAARDPSVSEDDALGVLRAYGQLQRRLQYQACRLISVLERRGTFADRGYRSAARAVGDLFGWDHRVATQRVHAAEDVSPRISPDGQQLPAKLVATADVFAAGRVDLAQVEVISQALRGSIADRIDPPIGPPPNSTSPTTPRTAPNPPSRAHSPTNYSAYSTKTASNPTTALMSAQHPATVPAPHHVNE